MKYNPFLFDKHTPNLPSILSVDFIQNEVRYVYEVEFTRTAILSEELHNYNPSKASVFRRTTDIDKQLTEIKFGSKISVDRSFKKTLESNTLWNNTVLGGFLKTNIELKELKDVIDWFDGYLKPLVGSSTALDNYITAQIDSSDINKQDVISILKKADFNISDIIIKKEKKEIPEVFLGLLKEIETTYEVNNLKSYAKNTSLNIEVEHTVNNESYTLPFYLESQGTQRYYGMAGLLSLLIRHSIAIPIDELESSLHPDLFTHFLLSFFINSKSSQIIATTHNREILSNRDIFRNDSIWFTSKDESGATELYSLSDFDSSVIRDTSSVYNAYKIGKLGGTPNLGDNYIDISQ